LQRGKNGLPARGEEEVAGTAAIAGAEAGDTLQVRGEGGGQAAFQGLAAGGHPGGNGVTVVKKIVHVPVAFAGRVEITFQPRLNAVHGGAGVEVPAGGVAPGRQSPGGEAGAPLQPDEEQVAAGRSRAELREVS